MREFLRKYLFHKYCVWKFGRMLGVSTWQLIVHDLSKLTPQEFPVYSRNSDEGTDQGAIDAAVNFHAHRNPHHWQFWTGYDKFGKQLILPIPEKYLLEMAADWLAVSCGEFQTKDIQKWAFFQQTVPNLPIESASKARVIQIIEENWQKAVDAAPKRCKL